MQDAKIYNGIYPKEGMAKAEKGTTVFLADEDIVELLSSKKIIVDTENGKITLAFLHDSNKITEREIKPFGKKGYYHIPVDTLGISFSTAFVVPASEVKKEKESDQK